MPRSTGFGTMGRRAIQKLESNNDFHALVVGTDSSTGIGKSTLAIELCRFLDRTPQDWDARRKAFTSIPEYIRAHQTYAKKSALLLDEIEAGADSRRATSHENVNLSQAWATMRAKNISTVATLPSVSMLDSRMLELSDYWILVKSRGVAQPFEVNINDFNGKIQRKPLNANKNGQGEHITFPDLPDGDPDKTYLDNLKDDLVEELAETSQSLTMKEHNEKLEKAVENAREKARRESRNDIIREVYQKSNLTYSDLQSLESVDVSSRGHLSDIINA